MMPGGPIPTKRRLSALVFLVRADSLAISTKITAGKLYVINYPQIWISKPGDSNISQVPDYKLAKISIDGPEWDTDIYVDVVIEVVNNSTNDSYLLIARHQYIQKLE
jgi:Uma2 family endonuclease